MGFCVESPGWPVDIRVWKGHFILPTINFQGDMLVCRGPQRFETPCDSVPCCSRFSVVFEGLASTPGCMQQHVFQNPPVLVMVSILFGTFRLAKGIHPGRLTAGTNSHHPWKEWKMIWTKPPGNYVQNVNLQGCSGISTGTIFFNFKNSHKISKPPILVACIMDWGLAVASWWCCAEYSRYASGFFKWGKWDHTAENEHFPPENPAWMSQCISYQKLGVLNVPKSMVLPPKKWRNHGAQPYCWKGAFLYFRGRKAAPWIELMDRPFNAPEISGTAWVNREIGFSGENSRKI